VGLRSLFLLIAGGYCCWISAINLVILSLSLNEVYFTLFALLVGSSIFNFFFLILLFQLVTLTTSFLPPWVELLVVYVSLDNWTLIFVSLLSILSHSLGSISSWLGLHHWHQEDPSNTVLWLYQNWLSRCGMQRTWCVLLIHAMAVIWLHQQCSVVRWAQRK